MEINPGTTYPVRGSVKWFLKAVAFPHTPLLARPRPFLPEYCRMLILFVYVCHSKKALWSSSLFSDGKTEAQSGNWA